MSLNSSFNQSSPPQRPKSLKYHKTDGHARNLCFVLLHGRRLFLSYAYLISGDVSPQENTLTLTFTTHIVTLKGRNFAPLFDSLNVHALESITAVEERYAATEEETESLVTHIDVQTL